MELIVLWAIMGGVVAIVANSKGFDTFAWFFYGALTGPIALAHVIVKPSVTERRAIPAHSDLEPADATKTCPDCAETIKAAATVCRFCGNRELPEQAPPGMSDDEAWYADLQVTRPKPQPTTWQKLWWNPHSPDRRP